MTRYPCGHVDLTEAHSCSHLGLKHEWVKKKRSSDIYAIKILTTGGIHWQCRKCHFAVIEDPHEPCVAVQRVHLRDGERSRTSGASKRLRRALAEQAKGLPAD